MSRIESGVTVAHMAAREAAQRELNRRVVGSLAFVDLTRDALKISIAAVRIEGQHAISGVTASCHHSAETVPI